MHVTSRKHLARLLLLLTLVGGIGAAGCGRGVGTVTGTVKYGSRVVKGGYVSFVSTEGKRGVMAPINEDGTYTAERLPIGNFKIIVNTESFNPAKAAGRTYSPPKDQQAPEGLKQGPSAAELNRRYTKIPPIYEKEETTPLEYTVVSGDQQKDVELK